MSRVTAPAARLAGFAFVGGGCGASMSRWSTVDTLHFEAAVVDSLRESVFGHTLVVQVGPAWAFPLGKVLHLSVGAVVWIKLHRLPTQRAVWRYMACTHQHVRVIVAIVAAFIRFMKGNVDGHAVSIGKLAAVVKRESLPFGSGHFMW
jgi:hypothetical protein